MSFDQSQISALKAPLDRAHVANRSQAGRQLSYVEGWHCIAEANRIFGFEAWDRETTALKLLGEPRTVGDKSRVGYMATVRVTVRAGGDVIVRDGSGFGSGIDKDVDQAHESAIKEAETDAMKRALMTFGNPFGLALYDKTQSNVADAPPVEREKPRAAVADHDVTPAGRKRKRGPRLTDLSDIRTTISALMENLRRQPDPDKLKAWAMGQATMIGSLPDGTFDDFMAVYDETLGDLIAQRVAS